MVKEIKKNQKKIKTIKRIIKKEEDKIDYYLLSFNSLLFIL